MAGNGGAGGADDVDDDGFGLEQVLGALGRDLMKASASASATPGYGLAVVEAEVELSFTVTRTTDRTGRGRFRFEVVPEAGPQDVPGEASTGHQEVRVHRIRLKLAAPSGPLGFADRSAPARTTEPPRSAAPSPYGPVSAYESAPQSHPLQHGGQEALRPVVEHEQYLRPQGSAGHWSNPTDQPPPKAY